eukprot:2588878-Rhodomonas_salina.1
MQFWRYQLGASLARERPLSEVRLVWLRIADAKTSVSRVESDCKCVQHRALHVASALSVSALNLGLTRMLRQVHATASQNAARSVSDIAEEHVWKQMCCGEKRARCGGGWDGLAQARV